MPPFDFGYSWLWTHGHLVPAGLFALLAVIGWRRKWARWIQIGSAAIVLWALAGFWIVQVPFGINRPQVLATEHFLEAGSGKVLDMGAGSGRSTLMVLLARPAARVVALDLFGNCCGIEGNSPERLLANAGAAGVADRVEPLAGDMRHMPLGDSEFEGIVSSYAIDHLNEQGMVSALAEAHRVLKPGGQFLLMVINRDHWLRVAYPVFPHGYYGRGSMIDSWRASLESAGFAVEEQGTSPGTVYFLARKIVHP